ncbi:hypothetical protein H072_7758 [Dactylellina haptotyla CBS 200.50]|uniref:Tc1-like transposase DDE domain-containing protein n=1 Tax=Dactylellina haptotyla (strain CBS 200.50) TaxID=1284197 RepID=S8A6P5_DACHA|nr:hypothetical protein H072_7758 [Dactylellina haptotyla CBS 200.50]
MLQKPRNRHLSAAQRGMLMGMAKSGDSHRKIEAIIGIPRSTVQRTLSKYIISDNMESRRHGRPRTTTTSDDRAIVLYTKRYDRAPLADISNVFGVSARTIKRHFYEQDIFKEFQRKKWFLDERLAAARLVWARQYIIYPPEWWDFVVFSDECSIDVDAGNYSQWVWRQQRQLLEVRHKGPCVNINPERDTGDSSNTSSKGVTAVSYTAILSNFYLDYQRQYPHYKFIQDNAPIHKARLATQWFYSNGIELISYPAYSLDLNPIEHAWVPLKELVKQHYPHLSTMGGRLETIKPAIADAIIHCWKLLDENLLRTLGRSIKARCKTVIKAKGWWTHY